MHQSYSHSNLTNVKAFWKIGVIRVQTLTLSALVCERDKISLQILYDCEPTRSYSAIYNVCFPIPKTNKRNALRCKLSWREQTIFEYTCVRMIDIFTKLTD